MIEGVDGVRIGLHVCRGNWSRKEEVLLTGDYERLLPAFTKIKVKQFVLEYATPRAGDVHVVGRALSDREIGLGVVNPRTAEPESVEEIVAKAELALEYYRPGTDVPESGLRVRVLRQPVRQRGGGGGEEDPPHRGGGGRAQGKTRVDPSEPPAIQGSGYVVKSLEAALWAFRRCPWLSETRCSGR